MPETPGGPHPALPHRTAPRRYGAEYLRTFHFRPCVLLRIHGGRNHPLEVKKKKKEKKIRKRGKENPLKEIPRHCVCRGARIVLVVSA